MKQCRKCKAEKAESEFYKRPANKTDGLHSWCKQCSNERSKAWALAHPDKRLEASRRNELRRKGTRAGYVRAFRAKHPFSHAQSRYNKTSAELEQKLAEQNGVCAVCGGTNPNGKRLAIDHDHQCCPGTKSCGKCVRGLLCESCNKGLGHFKDSASVLHAAAFYLGKY